MFISKLNSWLEKVDPYYTQRIILRKGLYLAVWYTFVNWVAKPDMFSAYATPAALLLGAYENQVYNTYQNKDKYLVVSFLLAGVGCVCFYLLFPYKFTLLIFAVAFFLLMYFLADKYYPSFKARIMQVIMVSAMNMTVYPEANLQIAVDIFFCIMLSLMVAFVALKLHRNLYPEVWYRAYKLYLGSIDRELSEVISNHASGEFRQGATHLNIIRAFKHLQPKETLLNMVRTTVHIRDLSFAFMHITVDEESRTFWCNFQIQLRHYLAAVNKKEPCKPLLFDAPCDKSQEYANRNLRITVNNWNRLCFKL